MIPPLQYLPQNMHFMCHLSQRAKYGISPPKTRECELAVPVFQPMPTENSYSKYFQSNSSLNQFNANLTQLLTYKLGSGAKGEGGRLKKKNMNKVR